MTACHESSLHVHARAGGVPTKNIIEDLTSSVQISQEMLRSSYKIYLIGTQVKNLTCSYQISLV